MDLLKRIRENIKSGEKTPIHPLVSDSGAQLHTKSIFKIIDKTLDKATEDNISESSDEDKPTHN